MKEEKGANWELFAPSIATTFITTGNNKLFNISRYFFNESKPIQGCDLLKTLVDAMVNYNNNNHNKPKSISSKAIEFIHAWIMDSLHFYEDLDCENGIDECHAFLEKCGLAPAPRSVYPPKISGEHRSCSITLPGAPTHQNTTDLLHTFLSWNVNGLVKRWNTSDTKEGFRFVIRETKYPSVLFLTETKCNWRRISKQRDFQEWCTLHGYFYICFYWSSRHVSGGHGYGGVAILSKIKPLSFSFGTGDDELDTRARVLVSEFSDISFLGTYSPNDPRDLDQKLKFNKRLRAVYKMVHNTNPNKPLVITGDMNCAPRAIDWDERAFIKISAPITSDTWLPAVNKQEVTSNQQLLQKTGCIDAWVQLRPASTGHMTWCSHQVKQSRKQDIGLRLDHVAAPKSMFDTTSPIQLIKIENYQIGNSDHTALVSTFLRTHTSAAGVVLTLSGIDIVEAPKPHHQPVAHPDITIRNSRSGYKYAFDTTACPRIFTRVNDHFLETAISTASEFTIVNPPPGKTPLSDPIFKHIPTQITLRDECTVLGMLPRKSTLKTYKLVKLHFGAHRKPIEIPMLLLDRHEPSLCRITLGMDTLYSHLGGLHVYPHDGILKVSFPKLPGVSSCTLHKHSVPP